MEFREWEKKYIPIETVERIPEGTDPNCIWTQESCDGRRDILSGVYWFNKINFIITEIPFKNGESIFVPLEEPFYL